MKTKSSYRRNHFGSDVHPSSNRQKHWFVDRGVVKEKGKKRHRDVRIRLRGDGSVCFCKEYVASG